MVEYSKVIMINCRIGHQRTAKMAPVFPRYMHPWQQQQQQQHTVPDLCQHQANELRRSRGRREKSHAEKSSCHGRLCPKQSSRTSTSAILRYYEEPPPTILTEARNAQHSGKARLVHEPDEAIHRVIHEAKRPRLRAVAVDGDVLTAGRCS